LNIGQPDIHSPKEFIDALHAFSNPVVAYDSAQGNADLISAWVRTINTQYKTALAPENMVITSGSSEALTFAFNICCDAGDNILVFAPTYANYTGFATMTGINLNVIQCSFDSGFHAPVNKHEIEKCITKKTRAILICNPNNPTGTVFTEAEIRTLLDICEQHDLFLIVDEVYREFVYDTKPTSALEIAPHSDRVVVVDSISKRYSLCGARIGCIISHNENFIAAATNFAGTRVSAPIVEQIAAAHMLNTIPDNYLTETVREYAERRATLISNLSTIPDVEVCVPEGGFYVFAKLPVKDSADFCKFMLGEFSHNGNTVALAPALGFFISKPQSKSYVRIAFVVSVQDLISATDVLRHALEAYQNR
jgi:aspartate aminotransferase